MPHWWFRFIFHFQTIKIIKASGRNSLTNTQWSG